MWLGSIAVAGIFAWALSGCGGSTSSAPDNAPAVRERSRDTGTTQASLAVTPATTPPSSSAANGSATKSFGRASPSDYDISITDCAIAGSNLTTSGVITNKANRSQGYTITVEFSASASGKLGTDDAIRVTNLANGEKTTWRGSSSVSGQIPQAITCKVSAVDYWSS